MSTVRENMTDMLAGAAGKVAPAPPMIVSALSFAGVSLQDWVCIVTIGYTLLLAIHLLWKWMRGHG